MSIKRMAVAAPLALGLPILLWVALSTHEERRPEAASPAKTSVAESPQHPDEVPHRKSKEAAVPGVAGLNPQTQEQERPAPALGAAEKLAAEQRAEESARSTAQWRIRSWESLLGLTDAQKQSLSVLLTKWGREDAGGQPGRDTWLARESELRSQFTIEQAFRLHDSVAAEAQMHWGYMASNLSLRVGASAEQRSLFQQSLGEIRFPQNMILPEAYDGNYTSLLREAATRVRPILSPDQIARFDKLGLK